MSSTNKVKHNRSSAAYYKAMAVEQFYEHGHGASLFFESPYYDSYDGDSEENDIVPDRIVDRFGRTILSF